MSEAELEYKPYGSIELSADQLETLKIEQDYRNATPDEQAAKDAQTYHGDGVVGKPEMHYPVKVTPNATPYDITDSSGNLEIDSESELSYKTMEGFLSEDYLKEYYEDYTIINAKCDYIGLWI